jgi:hypothetical protein
MLNSTLSTTERTLRCILTILHLHLTLPLLFALLRLLSVAPSPFPQSRQLDIRLRTPKNQGPDQEKLFVHMLNSTLSATEWRADILHRRLTSLSHSRHAHVYSLPSCSPGGWISGCGPPRTKAPTSRSCLCTCSTALSAQLSAHCAAYWKTTRPLMV